MKDNNTGRIGTHEGNYYEILVENGVDKFVDIDGNRLDPELVVSIKSERERIERELKFSKNFYYA